MSARPEAHRPSRRRAVRRARWLRGPSRLLALLLSALLAPLAAGQALPPPARALPAGGKVVVGSGAIRSSGAQMTIDQATARLGIDWQRFDIGSAASVEFRQPSASAIALNRVIGNDASAIYGKLSANGQVFLTNPNGVLFAPGAKVDVGALVASTLDLSQSDFAAGLLRFKDVGSAAAVVNQGRLAAAPGGYIGLFGRQVDNDGEIAVRRGSVLLASGHAALRPIPAPWLALFSREGFTADLLALASTPGQRLLRTVQALFDNRQGWLRVSGIPSGEQDVWIAVTLDAAALRRAPASQAAAPIRA